MTNDISRSILATVILLSLTVMIARVVGKYLNKVYRGDKSFLDFLNPLEQWIMQRCGVDACESMTLKQYLRALLVVNGIWLIWAIIILMTQGLLPLNPAGNPSMDWALAFNSAISFLTSTNLQHYSGETGATYFSQIAVFMFLQFVSAAVSLAVGVAVVRALRVKTFGALGNFYRDFLLSITRVLIPLSIIAAVIFSFLGVPMTFDGADHIVSLQGNPTVVSTGPAAAFLPVKELGSNGGGFFGANDAHPFENPDMSTFLLHVVLVVLLPIAFIFYVGYQLMAKRLANTLFSVMLCGMVLITAPLIINECAGNEMVTKLGIHGANMEGKELRFSAFYSALYCGINVCIPAGTVVSAHDSFTPLAGSFMMIAMNIDAFFGGVGTGWLNMFIFLVIAIFIGCMMTGRSPQLLGRKIGLREIQITAGVTVIQTLVPMAMTGIAVATYLRNDSVSRWLSNPGPHGFTTLMYEFFSSTAGNGSGFESLGDNTIFWNLSTAVAMLTGRFIPIVGALTIAAILSGKPYTPRSVGTLRTEGITFGIFLFAIILVVSVLSLFPALMLGPVSEYLSFNKTA
jgi:potassium-transporting ATPase potassium-binding subunit